jgi:hypothetical protein
MTQYLGTYDLVMGGTCCTSGKMPHLGQDSLGSGTRTGCYQQVCLGILIMVMFQTCAYFSIWIVCTMRDSKTSFAIEGLARQHQQGRVMMLLHRCTHSIPKHIHARLMNAQNHPSVSGNFPLLSIGHRSRVFTPTVPERHLRSDAASTAPCCTLLRVGCCSHQ